MKRYRHHARYRPGGTDAISQAVSALFGLYGLGARDDLPPLPVLLPHAGLLALNSRSAAIVESIVHHSLGLPCRIEEFALRTIVIPEEERFHLGASGLALGENTLAGETMLDVTGHFVIVIDGLSLDEYEGLLPGSLRRAHLDSLLKLVIRDPLSWTYALSLRIGEAETMALGSARMGWTSWLDPSAANPVSVSLD